MASVKTLILILTFLMLSPVAEGTTKFRTSYTDFCADADIQSCWRMNNDLHDQMLDESTNDNHSTSINGATYTSDGTCREGNCYAFDGGNDSIIATNFLNGYAGDLTIAFWYKTSTTDQDHFVSANNGNDSGRWNCYIDESGDGQIAFFVNGSPNVSLESSNATNDGAWHHYAITKATSLWTLYEDGESVDTQTQARTLGTRSNMYLGRREYSVTPNWFTGSLDETSIIKDDLDSDSIKDLYLNGLK